MKISLMLGSGFLSAAVGCADVQAPTASRQTSRQHDPHAYELVDLGTFNGAAVQGFEMTDHGVLYGRWGQLPAVGGSFRWTGRGGFEDLGGVGGQPFLILAANKHDEMAGHVPTGPLPAPSRPLVKLRGQDFRFIDEPSSFGRALDINKHGVVVGFRQVQTTPPTPGQGFVWTERDGLSVLPVEFPGIPANFSADRINDDGTVAGVLVYRPWEGPPVRPVPYLWNARSGTRILPKLSEGLVAVTSLTRSEWVAGAAETRLPEAHERRASNPLNVQGSQPSDVPIHAWRWNARSGLEDLGTLGGAHSVSWGTDEDGNAFGWADDAAGNRYPVKWPVGGGVIILPHLGGNGMADPPNKHGIAVGQVSTPAGERRGAIWQPRR